MLNNQDRSAIDGGGCRSDGQGRGGGRDRHSRWNVGPRRTGPARGAAAQDRRGARDDRGAGEGAPCARDGGARSQNGGARGQDRGDGQEAWRQAAAAAGPRTAAERSGQSDGRRVAHHAGGGRRVRAVLQRAGGGGGGEPVGCRARGCLGAQRQGPGRTNAGEDRSVAEELGKVENLLADTGYVSADNVEACEKAGVVPVIAMGRQPHYLPLSERFAPAPEA